MTQQEYEERLFELNKKFKQDKYDLAKEFALSNNSVKIGDIVSDGNNIISVSKLCIDFGYPNPIPYVYYKGIKLTKKLKPFKSGEFGVVYDIKEKISKEE